MLPHTIPITPRIGALLVAVGVLCATGSLCFFVALKHTAAANVSQIHYTQLVTGALMAWLVWRQAPTLLTVAGAVLIIGVGAVYRDAGVAEITTVPGFLRPSTPIRRALTHFRAFRVENTQR